MRGPQAIAGAEAPWPDGARLFIPTTVEAAADYKVRLGALLAKPTTHVYIDTSFLMWATKIGPAARGQLLTWLREQLADRSHVPTWSGHEYLRHHVAGTIVKELTKRSEEVAQIAGATFSYFRPFLDDPSLPAAEGWDQLRTSTRTAVNSLKRLTLAASQWKEAYPAHAEQIISYINERILPVGGLFEELPGIADQGAARYEGRIPPGFHDRRKKGDAVVGGSDEMSGSGTAGANRYGDLIFWKEALNHAATVEANAAIILTNDRKNDWRMGGETFPELDEGMLSLKRSWRPVPRIHPMLELEAHVAGVNEVALVDSQYLAAFLSGAHPGQVDALVDVAVVRDPPPEPSKNDRRTNSLNRRLADDAAAATAAASLAAARAAEDGFRFADDPAVKVSSAALKRALLESRGGADPRGAAIIRRVQAEVEGSEPLDAVMTAETLAGMDHLALAAMARNLSDRAIRGEAGLTDPLVDLIGLLEDFPPATAGALVLGLFASSYLEEGTGLSRIPPSSLAATALLGILDQAFADNAVRVVSQRLADNDRRPVHALGRGTLTCVFDVEPETMGVDELRSLKVDGLHLLTAAQDDASLRLRDLVGGETASGETILRLAANLFVLPSRLLDAGGGEGTVYSLTETIGFRQPATVFRSKEER